MKKLLLICTLSFGFLVADDFVEYGPSFGGYGELHYNVEGESMDFHRFVLFFNNQFDDKWSLKSEVELEHNMVGADYDGELELEQAFINYHTDAFGFKGGVLLMPVGIINEYHEPPTFLSVERPSYHKYIIPTTWFGNGFQFYGNMGSFHWSLTLFEDMVGEGIGYMGSSKYAIRSARGKGETSTTTDFTKTVKLGWTGMGMKVGLSMTMNDAPITHNSFNDGGSVGVDLNELNFSYNANNIHAVFETATINYDWSAALDADGNAYTAGQSSASGYYLHLGYDIGSLFGSKLVPWVGMSTYTNDDDVSDMETTENLFGLTYWPHENVTIKMEMGTSEKGGNETDVFNIGLGYMF
tara:strand:+ start:69 stop:1130 length:1062 start_codon:yes stop_codon:yes gene_type:complete